MMYSDIVDEIDFLEGLQEHIADIEIHQDDTLSNQLTQAANIANESQWLALVEWLMQLTENMNLLLPDIQTALKSDWHQTRTLPEELKLRLK